MADQWSSAISTLKLSTEKVGSRSHQCLASGHEHVQAMSPLYGRGTSMVATSAIVALIALTLQTIALMLQVRDFPLRRFDLKALLQSFRTS